MTTHLGIVRLLILLPLFYLFTGCEEIPEHSPPYAVDGSQFPNVSAHPDGSVLMSWIEPDGAGHRLRFSRFRNGGWATPGTVARGDDWFVNWADFPSVRIIDDKFWVAHWLVKNGWNAYAYDVAVSMSHDAGKTWSDPIRPHMDETPTEHGFVSLYPVADAVGIVWLDGRETLEHTSGDQIVGMALRSAVLTRNGDLEEALIDPLVCDCCQTDVAISSGVPLLVYRDRDQREVRDIRLARFEESSWAAGQLVAQDDWQVFGCPVNGPAIDATGDHVGVAWYTQGSGAAGVRFARSTDGGESIQDAITIDSDGPTGRVDVVMDGSGCALVSWIGGGGAGVADLRYRTVGLSDKLSEVHTLAQIATARPSGFPRMAKYKDSVLVAWTGVGEQSSQVQTEAIEFGCL